MGASVLSSRAIIGEFYAKLAQEISGTWIEKISNYFTSDQESETYNWLGMSPAMREWIGGRHAKGFSSNGITIANKEYEATLEVLVKDLRRDKTGQILTRVRELAIRTNSHWASLLSTIIQAGESTVCYDGQYFFDTDHSEGSSGTLSNDVSVDISALPASAHGSTTSPSVEEMSQCIFKGIQAIVGFKDDQGEPMNENASNFLVMVPTSLSEAAYGAISKQLIGAGESNTLKASNFNIEVAVNPRLTWTAAFPVFRTDGEVKPLIRQEEEGVKIDAVAEGSELEFNDKKHHYGVSTSRNVGYGYWQQACLMTMT